MIDYATLRIIWWVIMGVLLIGFAIMDGFDLGVAALLPFVARTDTKRRIVINTIGPVWEGNQVWIIVGGAVFFAAWPYLYAMVFSGFYFAILLLLLTFILRPVAFKYRSKLQSPAWRAVWDWTLCIGGLIAALVFGVAIGNVLQGVPFHYDLNLRPFYTGTFFALFNPFAILCGFTSIAMLLMHGGLYLAIKTEDPVAHRALQATQIFSIILILLFIGGGLWIAFGIKGYVLTQSIPHTGFSNPLDKTVATQVGAWIANFVDHPWMWIAPILGVIGAFGAFLLSRAWSKLAFIFSSLSVFGIISTVGLSMFPFILPSSTNPQSSLLVWDASASQLSLFILFICVCIFLPIILAYTTWVYSVLRGKVTNETLEKEKDSAY